MTIFGRWLRERNRRIARAVGGDDVAAAGLANQQAVDPLGIDLEATRRTLQARIEVEERRQAMVAATRPVPCVGAPEGCKRGIRVAKDAPGQQIFVCSPKCEKRAEERKEQSILAALVFGCSCGSKWMDAPSVAEWLREHAHCAGLGAMVREDA